MKLTSTKCKQSNAPTPVGMETEEYPYGLRLSFGDKLLKKFGALKSRDVGSEVKFVCVGEVVSKEEHAGKNKNTRVEVQITKLGIKGSTKFKDAFNSKEDDEEFEGVKK